MELCWAHGFRSFDTRGNLRYDSNDNIVFTTAGVGVVYYPKDDVQKFFNMHKEDIVAMAIHPDRDIVATGQMAGKALNEEVTQKKNQGGKNKKAAKQGKLVEVYVWRAST